MEHTHNANGWEIIAARLERPDGVSDVNTFDLLEDPNTTEFDFDPPTGDVYVKVVRDDGVKGTLTLRDKGKSLEAISFYANV